MLRRVVGDVCEKIEFSFKWRIPNWKLYSSTKNNGCQSPSFQFSEATWNIEFWKISYYTLCFTLVRNKGMQNIQVVAVKLTAKSKIGEIGTECKIGECEFQFTKERKKRFFYISECNLSTDELSQDGDLIVFCTLSDYTIIANAATQTMSPKSEEDSSKETGTGDADQIKTGKSGMKDFENLSRNFRDLLVTGQNSDVTMKVNDREFPAHKLILGSRSSVFENMFRHDMVEKKEGVADITGCTPDAFKQFLFYLYSGEVDEFSRYTVFDLYMLSDKYDVQELKSASVNFIAEDLCMDNFCDAVYLALQHNESILLEKAIKFFGKNLKKIIVSAKWQSFIAENPIQANELYIKALNDVLPD